MFIGIGNPIPDLSNLPGASRPGGGGGGGGGLAQVDNLYSFEFDGVASSMSIPEYIMPSESSVSFWVKSSLASPADIIISGAAGHYYPYLLLSGGNIRLIIKAGAATNEIISDVPWVADTWFHIAITGTGGQGAGTTATYYINGVNKGTSLNRTPTLTQIGSYPTASLNWNGHIDEVAFWSVALTDAEILSIYNATTTGKTADLNALSTPPTRWYRMGD